MITMGKASRIGLLSLAVGSLVLLLAGSYVQISFADDDPLAKVRALQDGNSLDDANEGLVPGSDIDCVAGIEGSGTADEVICYLVPDGVPTPEYNTGFSEVQTSVVEGSCPSGAGFQDDMVCFEMTFDDTDFSNGHWRFVAEFYNNGALVEVKGNEFWTNHTFFVIPESPIGAAALIISSLGALAGFMLFKSRSNSNVSTFAHP